MADSIVDKPVQNIVTEAGMNKDTRKTNTLAEQLLLQQHRSLLVRIVASQAIHRAINTVIVALTFISMMSNAMLPYASVAFVYVASLVAYLWYSEQRLLATRLGAIERALAKKDKREFEDIYINYRFESSSSAARFPVLRFEPLLWLAVIAANAGFNVLHYIPR